jgi:hypothetical protein
MSVDTKEYYTGGPTPQIYPQALTFEDNTCFRYTDKTNNASERAIFANYWREQINLYGQQVLYYVNTLNTLSADMLYGEQPTQQFAPPLPLVMAINLNENALMLSKYGLLSEDEVTAFVPYVSFYARFGQGSEPKSGDVFQMSEYGSDRPNGRDGRFYEITERLDQDIAQINPLAGHYVWLVKAKRFEWSFEPGLSGSAVNNQIFDDTRNAAASGAYKPYSYSADVASRSIFDYSLTPGYDSVYGGY